jgi:hypothetical protein
VSRRAWLTVFIALAIALVMAGLRASLPRFTDEAVAAQTGDVFTEFLSSGHAHFGIAAVGASLLIGGATFGIMWLLDRRRRSAQRA